VKSFSSLIQRWQIPDQSISLLTMMKFATLTAALVGSASAFAPAQQAGRSVTSLNAEKSASLPFMNKPALVSLFTRIHTM
jgi:hypothetical protein